MVGLCFVCIRAGVVFPQSPGSHSSFFTFLCRNTNRYIVTEPAGHKPVPIPTQSYILKRSLTFSLCVSEEPFAVCCRFDFSFEVLS